MCVVLIVVEVWPSFYWLLTLAFVIFRVCRSHPTSTVVSLLALFLKEIGLYQQGRMALIYCPDLRSAVPESRDVGTASI